MADACPFPCGPATHFRLSGDALLGARGDESEAAMAETPGCLAITEGEIYNGAELGRLLGRDAADARRIIPELYEKFGTDFPKYLNGVFSIALWDKQRRRLCLVRDHLGSHSLFYSPARGKIAFASSIHPILALGKVSREISLEALDAYLASHVMPAPHTLLADVLAVPHGSVAVYENGAWSVNAYWKSGELREDFNRREQDWVEQVRETIRDAVHIRGAHGGRIGALASGGVDTSTIIAHLVQQRPAERLPVFSIVFPQADYSDAALQKVLVERLPLDMKSEMLAPEDFVTTLQKGAALFDRPVNDVAYVGMCHAFRMASQAGCTAVFDGEGADELFFTRHTFSERLIRRVQRIPFPYRLLHVLFPTMTLGDGYPSKVRRLLYRLGSTPEERSLTRLPSFYNHRRRMLPVPPGTTLPDPLSIGRRYLLESALTDPLNYYNYGITKTQLPDSLLYKNERMAAMNGITNRTPFVDHRLVELAYQIPERYKIAPPSAEDDGTKQVYKKAVRGLIPDEILRRKKRRGFSQPTRLWYCSELRDFVYDSLFDPNGFCRRYLDNGYMRQIVDEHTAGRTNFASHIDGLLILEWWMRAHLGAPAGGSGGAV